MDFAITSEQQALLDMAADFAKNEIAPHVEQFERDERFPRELAARMGELGLLGGTIPEEYGGLGLDHVTLSLLLEEIAYVDITAAVIAGWPSCSLGRPILLYGSDEQKERYLTPLCQGRIFGAHAVTEPHSGTDIVRRLETTVRKDGDHYVLNGTKTWISNAGNADFFLTYGTLDKSLGMRGICAFIVDAGTPGLAITPIKNKTGSRGQDTAQLFFEDLRVPAGNRLLPEGQGYKSLMCGTEIGRLACSARATGQIRACLDAAVGYAQQREVFGQPIGRYELVQAKIANMRVGLETSRLLVRRLAWLLDQGAERAQKEASIAKLHTTDTLMQCAQDAYQIHGAYGVAEEYKVGRYFRDAKVMQIYDGANEMHQQIIGEWELGYRRQPDQARAGPLTANKESTP
ncbi:MAG: acyl-CoA dehydrogenase family protein [Betaproteobacteria bacterium]|nr:acyl-CoA dehydrogenase family protein [Betaproteobacteria bacterium]